MRSSAVLACLLGTIAAVRTEREDTPLLKDINVIGQYWGQISPYFENEEDYFGIDYVGLPDGCQIEQVHTLQRHAQRFPTSYEDDGAIQQNLADKVKNFTSGFTGPLAFLNSYSYMMQDTGLLTGLGANTEFASGVSFWNRYGRTLYNASTAQLAYNASYVNGTLRPKPVLRTTSQARIENSQINWALGFFGTTFQQTPDPTFDTVTSEFDVVIIPEGGSENNTLASYDSCFIDYDATIGYLGDLDAFVYIPKYLETATKRMQQYAPLGFTFTTNDTFAMQSICAYETNYIGISDFCGLFTADEWAGFENVLDIEYYYDYGYGNPTGRAQGLGYLQELLARLQNQYITSSNSSVNSSLTDNPMTFPLGQPFYADFSHDDIIVSVLASMSLDYFREPPSLSQYPPNPDRKFIISHMTPFGARLITEVIGCLNGVPEPVAYSRVSYTPGQYGYNAVDATSKFVRMRLNNGILPLNTLREGSCGNATSGRVDGLCALGNFVESQKNAEALANYDFACFGNYTVENPTSGTDFDGTVFA